MKFEHAIRDPIHGLIPVTACEWHLLRTRAFSRLRGIRQMGTAYIVFPGAHHTRFEHAIGTMRTAWLLSDGLPLSEERRRLIRLAALCHDLGHRPFSHSLEDAARRHAEQAGLSFLTHFLDHEERTYELVAHDPEIGEVLSQFAGYGEIDRRELALLATGRHEDRQLNLFTHSEIDADRIDYVLRDNYYCGFAAALDVESLRGVYAPDPDFGLALDSDHLYLAQQLLLARFQLIANVQNHPLIRLGDLLLAECVQEALAGSSEALQARFLDVADRGQDADLEQFLRLHAPTAWPRFESLVSGRPPISEGGRILTFEFPVLSPVARLGIQSLRLVGHSVAQQLQDRLEQERPEGLLVDITRAKPPVDPLPCTPAGQSGLRRTLTELPAVEGVISASMGAGAVRVYAPTQLTIGQDFDRWASSYRAVDPSLDRGKAVGILDGVWGGDRDRFTLLLAIESLLQDMLLDQVRTTPSRLDVLFLMLYQTLSTVSRLLGQPRLYLDGTEALWAVVSSPAVREELGDRFPSDFRSDRATGAFASDLQYLERCGLLYIVTRLERVRNAFVERPKYGTTGWGRQIARRMFEAGAATWVAAVDRKTEAAVRSHEQTYREYFAMLAAEGQSDMQRRRDLRRHLPLPVTL